MKKTYIILTFSLLPIVANATESIYYSLNNKSKQNLYIDDSSKSCTTGGLRKASYIPNKTINISQSFSSNIFSYCYFRHSALSANFSFDNGRKYKLWIVRTVHTLTSPTKYVPKQALQNMLPIANLFLLATTAPQGVVTFGIKNSNFLIEFNPVKPKTTRSIKVCSDLSSKNYGSKLPYIQSFVVSDKNPKKVKGYHFYAFQSTPDAGRCKEYTFNISENDLNGKYIHLGIANPSVRIKQPDLTARFVPWTDIGKIKFSVKDLSHCYVNMHYDVAKVGKVKGKTALICT